LSASSPLLGITDITATPNSDPLDIQDVLHISFSKHVPTERKLSCSDL
jgi:hypothetical protein